MSGSARLRMLATRSSHATPGTAVLAAAGLAALAWIALAVDLVPMPTAMAGGEANPMSARALWICILSGGAHMGGQVSSAGPVSQALTGMPMWSLMALAMMLPAALPATAHVASNSLRRRRGRAVFEFLVAYLVLWLAVGVPTLLVVSLLPLGRATVVLAAGLGLAALWELSALKVRALNRCHRTSPLPPSGWRASLGSARFGVVHGSACIASCWPLMLVMAVAPSARLAWCALLGAIGFHEKVALKPRRAARRAGAALAFTAFMSLAVSFAGL